MKSWQMPPLAAVSVSDGLMAEKQALVRDVVVPYQWEALNDRVPGALPSGAVSNFYKAAGLLPGEHIGFVFQDSDVGKWMEAVGYLLAVRRDERLERLVDDIARVMAKAQQPDGYLNTYFIMKAPDKKWSNLQDQHELYTAGHLLEGAIAYYEATGKRVALDVMIRFADLIVKKFGPGPGQARGVPGHEEIELALVKLYRVTGERKYLDLAAFFINERGAKPNYFDVEREKRDPGGKPWYFREGFPNHEYNQSHLPVRRQKDAVGHSVRAMYLYCGMADVAAETGDEELLAACSTLFDSVAERQMYITGGVGQTKHGEAFTFDDHLPGDYAYTETCASIGLCLFAQRMLLLTADGRYADAYERALYNGVLSGVSQDGRLYFYSNPLEVWPQNVRRNMDLDRIDVQRRPWLGCACCPPNLARFIASMGQAVYALDGQGLAVNQYVAGRLATDALTVRMDTDYPWDGEVTLTLERGTLPFVRLRKPAWCDSLSASAPYSEDGRGYIVFSGALAAGDSLRVVFDMPPRRVYARPSVRACNGRVAVQRGPVVYCAEEADNGPGLNCIVLPKNADLQVKERRIYAQALREEPDGPLYGFAAPRTAPAQLTLIPYYSWANRTPGEMLVWLREK